MIRENGGSVAQFTRLGGRPSGDYKDGTFYTNGKDKIWIYARYFSTYTIAYTTAASYQVTFDDGNGNVAQTIVEEDSRVAKPDNPVRAGYVFTGWYKGDIAYNFDTPVNAYITLTAHWEHERSGGDSDSHGDSGSGSADQWNIWQTPAPTPINISTAEADTLAKGLKSRAPKTGDPLPALWLWHLLLLSGAAMIIHSLNTKKASRRA